MTAEAPGLARSASIGPTRARILPLVKRLRALRSANPLVVDALIAAALTALSLVALVGGARDIGLRDQVSIALLLLQTIPLIARRRFPVAVAIVCIGATLAHVVIADAGSPVRSSFGYLVAIYTVAEQRERQVSGAIALVAGVGVGAVLLGRTLPNVPLQTLIQNLATVAIVWLLGTWAQDRRGYTEALEDRARLLEHQRADEARRAVSEERERIARELHDVVTHHVSVMVIQAGAGARVLDKRPDDARAAFGAIEGVGRRALADMRRMLGILGDGGASRDPAPGLDQVGDLLEQVRRAGLPVELSIHGERRPLDPGIELSGYRIIQEALTNTLKHAHGARATVDVRYEPTALAITVTDSGGGGEVSPAAVAGTGSGRGLLGMRERAAVFGGSLDAHPTSTGFRVAARLPLETEPAAS